MSENTENMFDNTESDFYLDENNDIGEVNMISGINDRETDRSTFYSDINEGWEVQEKQDEFSSREISGGTELLNNINDSIDFDYEKVKKINVEGNKIKITIQNGESEIVKEIIFGNSISKFISSVTKLYAINDDFFTTTECIDIIKELLLHIKRVERNKDKNIETASIKEANTALINKYNSMKEEDKYKKYSKVKQEYIKKLNDYFSSNFVDPNYESLGWHFNNFHDAMKSFIENNKSVKNIFHSLIFPYTVIEPKIKYGFYCYSIPLDYVNDIYVIYEKKTEYIKNLKYVLLLNINECIALSIDKMKNCCNDIDEKTTKMSIFKKHFTKIEITDIEKYKKLLGKTFVDYIDYIVYNKTYDKYKIEMEDDDFPANDSYDYMYFKKDNIDIVIRNIINSENKPSLLSSELKTNYIAQLIKVKNIKNISGIEITEFLSLFFKYMKIVFDFNDKSDTKDKLDTPLIENVYTLPFKSNLEMYSKFTIYNMISAMENIKNLKLSGAKSSELVTDCFNLAIYAMEKANVEEYTMITYMNKFNIYNHSTLKDTGVYTLPTDMVNMFLSKHKHKLGQICVPYFRKLFSKNILDSVDEPYSAIIGNRKKLKITNTRGFNASISDYFSNFSKIIEDIKDVTYRELCIGYMMQIPFDLLKEKNIVPENDYVVNTFTYNTSKASIPYYVAVDNLYMLFTYIKDNKIKLSEEINLDTTNSASIMALFYNDYVDKSNNDYKYNTERFDEVMKLGEEINKSLKKLMR